LKRILWGFIFLILFGLPAFTQYNVGVLQFDLPENWDIQEEGMSFFAVSPNEDFYISGMVFYGLPDIDTAKKGIMPLTRDMFRGLRIVSEIPGTSYNSFPCLLIEGTGNYINMESTLYMLIVHAGDHVVILQVFGGESGWSDNMPIAQNIKNSIQLTF